MAKGLDNTKQTKSHTRDPVAACSQSSLERAIDIRAVCNKKHKYGQGKEKARKFMDDGKAQEYKRKQDRGGGGWWVVKRVCLSSRSQVRCRSSEPATGGKEKRAMARLTTCRAGFFFK